MATPDFILQELKNTVAVVCRELVYTKKSEGATIGNQEIFMEKVYHGSEGYASVLTEMLDGKGSFVPLFNKMDIESNREGNNLRTRAACMLELKEIFHRQPNSRYMVHENGFTASALKNYKVKGEDKLLNGRIITEKASDVIANYKFALKHYKDYTGSIQEKNPSGQSTEDMVQYLMPKMFMQLKGKTKMKNVKKETKAPSSPDQMGSTYIFAGFFAFLLFGPPAMAGYSLSCLTEDGKDVPKKGRKAARAEASAAADREREAGVGGHVPEAYHRGVAMRDKATVAHMANQSYQFELKHVRDIMSNYNSEHALIIKELGEVNRSIRDAKEMDDEDEAQEAYDWKLDIKKRLKEVKQKKRELEAEEKELRRDRNKKQVLAYYEQVGDFQSSTSTSACSNQPPSNLVVRSESDEASCITGFTRDISPNHTAQEDFSTVEKHSV